MSKHYLSTLAEVMRNVEESGFTVQFRVTEQGLQSLRSQELYDPDEIEVRHFYRFEGESSQDDSAILYAIETSTGEKGTLVDGYGPSGDPVLSQFMANVKGVHK
jgi:hypothetical protein